MCNPRAPTWPPLLPPSPSIGSTAVEFGVSGVGQHGRKLQPTQCQQALEGLLMALRERDSRCPCSGGSSGKGEGSLWPCSGELHWLCDRRGWSFMACNLCSVRPGALRPVQCAAPGCSKIGQPSSKRETLAHSVSDSSTWSASDQLWWLFCEIYVSPLSI